MAICPVPLTPDTPSLSILFKLCTYCLDIRPLSSRRTDRAERDAPIRMPKDNLMVQFTSHRSLGDHLAPRPVKQSGRPGETADDRDEDIIIEFLPRGDLLRVAAFDAKRMIEAVIIGHRSAPRSALEAAVLQKLRFIQGKSAT